MAAANVAISSPWFMNDHYNIVQHIQQKNMTGGIFVHAAAFNSFLLPVFRLYSTVIRLNELDKMIRW
jgi:hypothetical protein